MLKGTDLYKVEESAESALKVNYTRYATTKKEIDKMLYREAAKRILFKKCFEHCGFNRKETKYFNKQFYYEEADKGKWTFECFNDRIKAHFGDDEAKTHNLYFDFEWMKSEYDTQRLLIETHWYL